MKHKNDRDEELNFLILSTFVIFLSFIKIYFEYFTNNKQ